MGNAQQGTAAGREKQRPLTLIVGEARRKSLAAMNQILEKMMKGLVLHFLHQGTVDQAIEQGRRAGVPDDLLESLPGMMFEITIAACAVQSGERTLDDVANQITERAVASGNVDNFGRDDAVKMIEMTLAFIRDLYHDVGEDRPLPALTQPWFEYEMSAPTSGCSGQHSRR